MYRRLVTYAALFGIGVFLTNLLAGTFYWYASILYFDKFVHFLGGVFVVLSGAAFFHKQLNVLRPIDVCITLVLFAFIIGLSWEYFEYIVQFYIKGVHLADIADSIGDLIFDIVGGLAGVGFVIVLKKRYNHK